MQELYPSIGAAEAIRQLVSGHVAQFEAKLARSRESLVADIDIEIEDKLV